MSNRPSSTGIDSKRVSEKQQRASEAQSEDEQQDFSFQTAGEHQEQRDAPITPNSQSLRRKPDTFIRKEEDERLRRQQSITPLQTQRSPQDAMYFYEEATKSFKDKDWFKGTTGLSNKEKIEGYSVQKTKSQVHDYFDNKIDIKVGEQEDKAPELPTRGMYVVDEKQDKREGKLKPKKFIQQTGINPLAFIVFFLFVASYIFYIVIRAIYSIKGLNMYVWYGAIVLCIEAIMQSASAISAYTHSFYVKETQLPIFNVKKGILPKCQRRYHVRVVIPCYKESLNLVQATILAAHKAILPENCRKTVYLCDDGKDPQKRQWIDELNDEGVVYVSDRPKPEVQINGKSLNLNYCIQQYIFRDVKTPEDMPLREILCVFDADQVAAPEFFLKTVPLFDGGENVAMVLTPQIFANTPRFCDIFNNSNIHFWEYILPGQNALGMIFCTGSNFLVRLKYLAESGYFPVDSVTEDYQLGIYLTKKKYICRYITDYLAIGEAPEEIRNIFQQRSRWAKGPFQLLFRRVTPIIDFELPLLHQLFFLNPHISYVTSFYCTLMSYMCPIISLLTGVFPMQINVMSVLAVTIFYGCAQFVSFYCHEPLHFLNRYFSSCASKLLWVVYFKAAANSLRDAILGKASGFKVTTKGTKNNSILNMWKLVLGQIWPHILMILLSLAVIIINWTYGPVTNTRKNFIPTSLNDSYDLISTVWCLQATVGYLLVIIYAIAGQGVIMSISTLFCFIVEQLLGILALALMWVLVGGRDPKQWLTNNVGLSSSS